MKYSFSQLFYGLWREEAVIEITISSALAKELGLPPKGRYAVFCIETNFVSKPEAFSFRSNLRKWEALSMAKEISMVDSSKVRIGMICDHRGKIIPRNMLGTFATVRVVNE